MKVISIFLALVNSLVAGLVLLSCISLNNMSWGVLTWLAMRVTTGALVILTGVLTFRDGVQPVGPAKMLLAGLLLVSLGTASAMWGLHLTLVSGDVKNVMILFGGSLALQGIASILGLQEYVGMAV